MNHTGNLVLISIFFVKAQYVLCKNVVICNFFVTESFFLNSPIELSFLFEVYFSNGKTFHIDFAINTLYPAIRFDFLLVGIIIWLKYTFIKSKERKNVFGLIILLFYTLILIYYEKINIQKLSNVF